MDKVLAKNVKRCPFCSGAVHRYEHLFQCEQCQAIGDLNFGIMSQLRPISFYCEEHKYNPPPHSGMCFCPYCEFPEEMGATKQSLKGDRQCK